MEPAPRLVDVLKQLAAGGFDADDWLEWWENNAEWTSGQLNRGQWLRLKPPQPGRFGPPSRCTLISQQEAFTLLNRWGVEHERSNRYEEEWKVTFEEFRTQRNNEQAQKRTQLRSRLDCLKADFPQLASFLSSNLDDITQLGESASDRQVQQLEQALGAELPTSYHRFLSCTSALAYGDITQVGLPYTFRHPGDPDLPSAGRICFGEYWLEGDGDQVVFGEAASGNEPPVLYYNHSKPSVRVLSHDFATWIESIPMTVK